MMRFTTFFAVIVFANASGLYSLGDLASYGGLGDGSLSRQEIRSPDGITRGTLTYIDGDGRIKSISYGGDNDIEAQKATTEAPPIKAEEEREGKEEGQQNEDSPKESGEMKEESSNASSENNQEQTTPATEDNAANAQSTLPQPVSFTPEVAAARAAHFAARDQAILLEKLANNQEQLEAANQQQLQNQQKLLNQQFLNQQEFLKQQQISEYQPFLGEYYGAAKRLKTLNPYYYL